MDKQDKIRKNTNKRTVITLSNSGMLCDEFELNEIKHRHEARRLLNGYQCMRRKHVENTNVFLVQ